MLQSIHSLIDNIDHFKRHLSVEVNINLVQIYWNTNVPQRHKHCLHTGDARMRNEHIRACIIAFTYMEDSLTLSWGFAGHCHICLQQEITVLCTLSWSRHVRDSWFLNPPWRQLCSALQSLGWELSQALAVALSWIQAVNRKGKDMNSGEVKRSVWIWRDETREGGQLVQFYHLSLYLPITPFHCTYTHTYVPQSFLLPSILPW